MPKYLEKRKVTQRMVTKEQVLMCRLNVKLPKKEWSTFLSSANTAGL